MSARTPSYRLHKASGQAVVTLNGRDVYLGRHGTQASEEAYDRAIGEWLANGRQLVKEHDTTVSELVVRYLEHVDASYTSNEPRNIRLALRPAQELYGMTPAREFGPLALKVCRQRFVEGNLSRGEVNKRTRRIVRLFKWAVAEQLVLSDVLQALRAVEGIRRGRGEVRESDPVKPVPDALVDLVQSHVSRQIWAMIQLQRLTGARPGEICMMRTADLVTAGRIWEYRPSSHKTAHHGKHRTIYIGPQAQQVLRPWLRTELEAYLFQPIEAEAERRAEMRTRRKTRVQPSQRCRKLTRASKRPGDRYTTGSYRQAITKGCRKAGIEPWHPHQLRHSAANEDPPGVRSGRRQSGSRAFVAGSDRGLCRARPGQGLVGGDGQDQLITTRGRDTTGRESLQ